MGVTPLLRYSEPNRHRLAVSRFPGVSGYTAYPAPPISRWGEDGFSSCLTCPCHRAAPTTPPECHDVSVSPRHAMLPSPVWRGLSLRCHFFSRPPVGSLALRPGDSLTIPRMALSVGFIRFVSATDATQATKLPTLALMGLTPIEHVSLPWTHSMPKIPFRLKSLILTEGIATVPTLCSLPYFPRCLASDLGSEPGQRCKLRLLLSATS